MEPKADPRLPIYGEVLAGGIVKGLPYGRNVAVNIPAAYSRIGNYFRSQGSPMSLLNYAQVLFMRAEAAKLGYEAGGDAAVRRASLAPNHIARTHPDVLLSYCSLRILDPGRPEVRNFVTRVVMDVVRRYDVDGIHFDDYFYPYPVPKVNLNDETTFQNYSRGFTNKADWRRDNVNLLVKTVSDSIRRVKPWIKFGVSPFGIWRNRSSSPEGSNSRGFEAFSGNFSDSRKWVQEGWVDYIAPQVYWSMESKSANYAQLVSWWSDNVSEPHLYIGHGVYKVNSDPHWKRPLEVPNQVRYNRSFENVHARHYVQRENPPQQPQSFL